ncbi:hypothetical protein Q0F99_19300 [Rathayibacter oskolensis]|uniref:hypothetical protein n=1 Tax=Rathayibacter oskolensis TaxID=1891671 RepID=UPI00265DF8B5|nr:hypothetical protein [Rathayibacter oskolensis]WKK71486.1 hypothetical protein Q0F99_19300 [Rathayibacter oskolensis]
MGFRQIRVSDLTGAEATEDEIVTIIVRQHPDLDEPKQFDALPIEVKDLKPAANLVSLEIRNGETTEMVVTLAEFNKLAPNISATLENADGLKGRRKGYKPGS